jgi:hypothetical protein
MLDRLLGRRQQREAEPPTTPASGTTAAQTSVQRQVDAALAVFERDGAYMAQNDARKVPEMAALLDAPEEQRGPILMQVVERYLGRGGSVGAYTALSLLGRRRLVLSPEDLTDLTKTLAATTRNGADSYRGVSVLEMVSQAVERSFKELPAEATVEAGEYLRSALTQIDGNNRVRLAPTARERLMSVAAAGTKPNALAAITDDDALGPALRAVLEPRLADDGSAAFIAHITTATKAGKASPKWLEATRTLAQPIDDAPELVRSLLQVALDTEDSVVTYDYTGQFHGGHVIEMTRFVTETNEAILRNIVWAAAALRDPAALPLLRGLTQKCVTVIGGQFGNPRSLSVALAGPAAIGAMGLPGSLGNLQTLQRSVRHGSVLREITKAMDALATSANVSRSELLETAVEDHGLDRAARRTLRVGDWTAIVALEPPASVTTSWQDPSGAAKASLPKAIRDTHADEAKAVAALVKEIRATVATERDRLDRLFIEDRRWPLEQWRERYLAHPITGTLARTLVWRFAAPSGEVIGLPDDDGRAAATESGNVVAVPEDAEVRLWHPVEAPEASIRAWRDFLLDSHRGQVTKQVFREIYTITPAELETSTYSNRFARHVIRQNQARSLMKGRGWAPVAVAWWDDGIDTGVARRKLEPFGLRVEFFYDPITDIQPTSSDLWPYCATDQVRFFDLATDRGVELARVPPVAFSEVMRDVDLFVGVTTIGADPQWLDRGERRFDTYWNTWGFGELSEPAKIRRQVIDRILPALRIADRCTLSDRFLEVRGELRTYKIHLGSGNILMSPADRYLCIVATRHPAEDRLFLPFDDDPTLSLILSKAFLLAEDDKIADQSIVAQIKGG